MSLAQKTISFKALQRCRTTIEDFCSTCVSVARVWALWAACDAQSRDA
jgi:hypothetical protein